MDTIDWDELNKIADEAGVGVDLPDDEYEFKVVGTNVGASQGGKPQIGVQLEVQAGPFAGKRVWDNLTLSLENPKAVAMFRKNCKAYGADDALLAGQVNLEKLASAFEGTVGTGKVSHRDYNGRTFLDVKNFKRHNGSQLPPAPAPILPAPGVPPVPPPPVPGGNSF